MTRYGMLIDTKRCVACNSCVVGCKVENNLPQGMFYNRMVNEGGENPDSPSGTYTAGDMKMSSYTMACQQCTSPACEAVCPTGATYIDEETNLVLIDNEKCIGCGLCQEACPYDVRRLQEDEPAYFTDFAIGAAGAPTHVKGTMEKCSFCYHRVKEGGKPFCVEICPARARTFGDLDDPDSEISQKLAAATAEQLMVEAGTEPNVYILR